MIEMMNLSALTVPFGAAYTELKVQAWRQVVAGIFGLTLLGAVIGCSFLDRSLGFPFCMRCFTPTSAHAEPLPGRPEVQINTKLDAQWTIVGMNYDWMVMVAKAHLQIGKNPEAYMRWEHSKPQKSEDGKIFLSEVLQVELDCPANRWSILVALSFAGNNLSGVQIYSGHADPRNPLWDTPDPQSIFGASIRRACELFGQ